MINDKVIPENLFAAPCVIEDLFSFTIYRRLLGLQLVM